MKKMLFKAGSMELNCTVLYSSEDGYSMTLETEDGRIIEVEGDTWWFASTSAPAPAPTPAPTPAPASSSSSYEQRMKELVDRYTDPETGDVDWAEVYEESYMFDM